MAVMVLVAAAAVCPLLAWVAYLRFLRFLVKYTQSSSCLEDAAVATRAFGAAGLASAAQVAAKALGQSRR